MAEKYVGLDVTFGKCTLASIQNGKPAVIGNFASNGDSKEDLSNAQKLASKVLGTSDIAFVMTVPAIHTSDYLEQLNSQAKSIDVNFKRAIFKTDALALAYGSQNRENGLFCVLNVGSDGYFEFSVIKLDDGLYDVKSVTGKDESELNLSDSEMIAKCKQAFEKLKKDDLDTQKVKVLVYGNVSLEVHNALAEIGSVVMLAPEMLAFGAALQGAVLSGDECAKDILLLTLVPMGVGFEVGGRESCFVIKENTTIPTKKSVKLKPVSKNAKNILVNILRGNHKKASENETIETFSHNCEDDENKEYSLTIVIESSYLCSIELKDSKENVLGEKKFYM